MVVLVDVSGGLPGAKFEDLVANRLVDFADLRVPAPLGGAEIVVDLLVGDAGRADVVVEFVLRLAVADVEEGAAAGEFVDAVF